MKPFRSLAAGAAAVLIGVSVLAVGTSANADDFYVVDTDFAAHTDGDPYPAGWFTGDVGGAPGTFESTASGLEFVGPFQILNSDTPTTGLVSLVDGAELGVVSGEIAFQISLFADGAADTGFTTLVPEVHGDAGLHSIAPNSWRTTQAIGVTYAANDTATLAEFETALGADYEILAFGAYLPLTKSAVVSHITWAGDTHWFLPTPTATVTPASVSKTDASDTGVTGVFTGFIPGESVEIGLGMGNSGGGIDTATADADGVVTYTLVLDADPGLGTYSLGAIGDSGVSAFAEFEVVADALPATGVETAPVLIAGGALLLLGAGFVVFTMRRRASA